VRRAGDADQRRAGGLERREGHDQAVIDKVNATATTFEIVPEAQPADD
jgi:hypothetical protein